MVKRNARFIWDTSDVKVSKEISIPNNLKPIVKKAPKKPEEIISYLQELKKEGTISADEINFLIASGVFV